MQDNIAEANRIIPESWPVTVTGARVEGARFIIEADLESEKTIRKCNGCENPRISKHGTRNRKLIDVPAVVMGGICKVIMTVTVRRWYCRECGHVREEGIPFRAMNAQFTERLVEMVRADRDRLSRADLCARYMLEPHSLERVLNEAAGDDYADYCVERENALKERMGAGQ